MQKRKLGFTDLEFTTVGLGTWAIGGPWEWGWGPQDDEASIATIQKAIDLGVNWLDTAPAYGLGHSEEVIGKAIKGRRDKVYIATKCGLVWNDPSERRVFNRLDADSVRQEVEDSLRRLDVDVIDLYQIHWPNPDAKIEEAWGAIADMIETGKLRYAGVSNFNITQIKRLQAIHPVASLQPPYSMLVRGVEAELLGFCQQNEIGVIPYGTMYYGLLTGKFNKQMAADLPDDDHRSGKRDFQEPNLSVNLEFVEKLRPIADRNDKSLAHLAIAWVLQRPEITAAIVGARRPDQIEETVKASDWQLSAEDVAEIEALLAEREELIRGS
ncbi:MAG: aldo/keto reductase [Anaerolineales bacterium]|nr:aldo/keto reductase [Anaerolineales bacterium]